MNKNITKIAILFFITFSFSLYSQDRYRDSKVKRFSFLFESGIIPIGTKPGKLDFKYVNPDYNTIKVENSSTIKDAKTTNYSSFLFEWQSKRDIIFRTLLNVGKSGELIGLSNASLGVGYAFGGEQVQVFPFVDWGFGNANIPLGNINNKYGYMYVNDQAFSSKNISVKFGNNYRLIRPSVGVNFNVVKWLSIRANVGYTLVKIKKFSKIEFDGYLEEYNKETKKYEDVAKSASLPFDSEDLSLKFNNQTVTPETSFMTNKGGLHFSLGVSINLINNLFDGR